MYGFHATRVVISRLISQISSWSTSGFSPKSRPEVGLVGEARPDVLRRAVDKLVHDLIALGGLDAGRADKRELADDLMGHGGHLGGDPAAEPQSAQG